MTNDYTFPFDTCEEKKDYIAQPYSAFLNLVNCFIIIHFLNKSTNINNFNLLLSILAFELFHVLSHTIHIKGKIQTNITHMLAYIINYTFLILFINLTKVMPSNLFIYILGFLISLDIYAFINLDVVYFIVTQSIIFLMPLFYYYSLLPIHIQNAIIQIFIYIVIIIILFINEKKNCKEILEKYNKFPLHTLIEFTGILLFYTISSNFYNL